MASTKTPAQLKPGVASDTSVVHASENDDTNLSRKHTERDISRRQSASKSYSETQTYKIGDIVTFENVIYRCIQAVIIPEMFDSLKWKSVIKQLVQFMISTNNSNILAILSPTFFPINAGNANPDVDFLDRASPIPINIELDQFSVSISINNMTSIEDREWILMIGDEIGRNEVRTASVDIDDGVTGIFTNTEDKVLVLAGQTIAYGIFGTGNVRVVGATCRVT